MADTVGFIGLGIMGLPMARNLLRTGFPVVAWNRTASKAAALAAEGAQVAATPADVASRAGVVVVCVTASADVEAVIEGDAGVLHGLRPGAIVIDMSTISPEVTKRLAARVRAAGGDYLDAPVSGGEQGAVNGTLSIMVGGEASTLDRARPVLAAMGQRVTHCVPVGSGQTVKLCNQIAVCLNNLAMAEALLFCQRSGVDPSVMLEAISVEARHGGDTGTQALVRALETLAGVEVGGAR